MRWVGVASKLPSRSSTPSRSGNARPLAGSRSPAPPGSRSSGESGAVGRRSTAAARGSGVPAGAAAEAMRSLSGGANGDPEPRAVRLQVLREPLLLAGRVDVLELADAVAGEARDLLQLEG